MKKTDEKAIVVIGNHTQGLGIVRSAKDVDYPVYVLYDKQICASRFSRYLTEFYSLKRGTIINIDEKESSDYLCETLLSLPVAYPSVLLGVNEDIIRFIDSYKKKLDKKYCIPSANLNRIFDKLEFNNCLPEEVRIPTYLVSEMNISELDQTYILKGRQGNILKNFAGEKAIIVNHQNKNMIVESIDSLPNERLIVQKIIKSSKPVFSVCTFCVQGEIMGLFMYEKLRQHPSAFGTGTYLKSAYSDNLLEISRELLRKLSYTGISEIEFIFDEDTRSYRVIETNPRTWKSIIFATQCGQNLVAKFVKFVMKEGFDSSLNFQTNKYWVDLYTDIPQMVRERRMFKYHKDLFECTWNASDPAPFFAIAFLSPFIALGL